MIAQQQILHVANVEEWQNARSKPTYAPATYAREGFIHCCRPEQLGGVLDRHFQNAQELTLLVLDMSYALLKLQEVILRIRPVTLLRIH